MTVIFTESFTTDGNGTRYSTSTPEFSDGSFDFFSRVGALVGTTISGTYEITGNDGAYFAAQDIDGEGAALPVTLDFTGIDISSFTDLSFSVDAAEDDSSDGNEDWDLSDFVHIDFQIDGGGYQSLLHFESVPDGDAFNAVPAVDTDFDGDGDGTELTNAFQTFTAAIAGLGSTLDVRATFSLNAGDEDIAFDNFVVEGTEAGPTVVVLEDFEDADVAYTVSTPEFSDGFFDFFIRTDGTTNIGTGYDLLDADGTFFAAQDLDGEGAALPVTMDFTGLDIAGLTDLQFAIDVAEDTAGDSAEDWDLTDFFHIDYQIDGGGFQNLLHFESVPDGDAFNAVPAVDTDFDGDGDGTELTDTFQTFLADIAGTGSTLDLRLTYQLNAGDEDVAIDNVLVTGTSGGTVTPSLQISDVTVSETDGTATFDVTLSADVTGGTQVDFTTVDGTALAGSDYVATSGTLIFAGTAGETQQVTVDLIDDTDVEADETFTVALSNATNGVEIADDTGEGTITSDEVALTKIHEIQGTEDQNLLDDQVVTVEAIVVGDFQDGDADDSRDLRGFYIQEEDADADGDVATSEGIFVFENGDFITDVNVGDKVQITGTVDEFFGETQLDTITDITIISSGNTLPTAATIDLPSSSTTLSQDGDFQPDLEAFEGMLVTFADTLTITEMFQLDRFNEIKLTEGDRPEQFTQFNDPDAASFAAYLEEVGSRTITYDDGLSEQNAAIGNLDGFGPTFSTATDIRMGDTIDDLSGVLSYQWAGDAASGATWRVRATQDGENTFDKVNEREDAPEDVGSDYKVASLNVLNFFTTLDEFPDADEGSGPNGLDPRGADANPQNADPTPAFDEEYNRQLDKLVQALVAMDADVVGLVELENDFATGGDAPTGTGNVIGSGVAIQELVDAVNASLGGTIYDWVRPSGQTTTTSEFVGGDAIAVGFIYDTTSTTLVGDAAVLDTEAFIDPNSTTDGGRNRAALAQTFQEIETRESFTASVNHFKSKGSSGLTAGDAADPDSDQLDGQGFWNDTRTKAAIELEAWLAGDPTGSGDEDILILGDLNAYANEDPITYLESQGFTDLAEQFVGEDAYSFVFDGLTGTLDYALANAGLLDQVTGATEWHVNADEPDALDYNLEFGRDASIFDGSVPFRNSDHDPVIIGLDLGPDEPTVFVSVFASPDLQQQIGAFGDFDLALNAAQDGNAIVVNEPDAIGGIGQTSVADQDLTVIADAPFYANFFLDAGVTEFTLQGTTNADVRGTTAADVIFGSDGNNVIRGRQGDDFLAGGAGNDILAAGMGVDQLFGGEGIDDLRGGNGNDSLFGGEGADRLDGGNNEDFLDGGTGNDLLLGRAGGDTFYYERDSDRDLVLDFENDVDTILFNTELWDNADLTAQEVVDQFADQVGRIFTQFTFGNGDTLQVRGVADVNELVDDIEFITALPEDIA
ncbi:MAG: ExeM/NucH family extracellular endonuclease [Pseudomonadota bacterium]